MNTRHSIAEPVKPTSPLVVVLFWLYVGIPLAWGIWSTMQKAMALFH